jgi:hypothetical protein
MALATTNGISIYRKDVQPTVKDAFVKRYGIMANRLDTTGFGKSQSKDTNDKRVELMR